MLANGGQKTAFITGITGQDGSYLSELLLQKGYQVHGLARRNSSADGINLKNLRHVESQIVFHKGDITDPHSLTKILGEVRPSEIYHLAAQSHVSQSFETPDYTMQVNTTGTLNLLQAIIVCRLEKHTRLYNAATSELFGGTSGPASMLSEESPFSPKSPYAISKLAAYWLVRNYRDSKGLWAVNGILFNHESARRGSGFVTMRIARGVAAHVLAIADKPLTLAGVNMARDWGHARDYVQGIWLMLQQEQPRDMVLATGKQHTVQEFVEAAFRHVGIRLRWLFGPDKRIIGAVDLDTEKTVLQIDQDLQRAVEVPCLLGDSTLAKKTIGWQPVIPFESLVAEMVDAELSRLKADGCQITA
ncbi:GDP-mannose 4,6 dehydratase [Ilyonectria sp. MPI-CAGE-AT-0026]|nr:GDP-mannose 4,6 dehydratase [Ilyonectria sp. MPI-CAGE-AT-0026]